MKHDIKKKIVVVGGTLGTDAHTVGIDAILSIKGLAGDKGLEYYPFFKVINLRAQVSAEMFVAKAAEMGADALLVSQLVTQQDQHLKNLKELNQIIKSEKSLSHLIKIVGGPRMDHKTAKSIGFDAGFGPGTKPSEVANYIVHELSHRLNPHKSHHHSTAPKKKGLLSWFGN
ncbi:MAG: cobalamin-dependent protein [Deltaproteobacteria bacterium]|nr:MAG: cobalamin-dependent protein [Deltaproteobacteria bacterium]